jgi:hypothetical protein
MSIELDNVVYALDATTIEFTPTKWINLLG